MKLTGAGQSAPAFHNLEEGRKHPVKIFLVNGSKVWLDPETAPAEAIPYGKPKAQPVKKAEPETKAQPEPANKAKKAPANKSRKAGSNK